MEPIRFTILKQLTNTEENNIEAVITTFLNEDAVGDIMDPSALDKYIEQFNSGEAGVLRILLNHDRSLILGKWNELTKTAEGVVAKGELFPDISLGKDVRTLIRRGVLDSVSIGFIATDYELLEDGGRLFKEIELVEVSVVDRPANERAVITDVKSEDGTIQIRAIEKVLRDAGLSKREARAFIAEGKAGLKNVWDAQEQEAETLSALKSFKLGD